MSSPLQLTVPDGAQVHIHLGTPLQPAGPAAATTPTSPPPAAEPKRHPLRLAVAAVVLFGAGYGLRSVSAPPANAQDRQVTLLTPPAPSGQPDSPAGAVLGSVPGLPPSIHVNPMPLPPGLQAGQAPSGYPGTLPRPQPGMAVRAPYPALPATPPASSTATATAPSPARNPFGLE